MPSFFILSFPQTLIYLYLDFFNHLNNLWAKIIRQNFHKFIKILNKILIKFKAIKIIGALTRILNFDLHFTHYRKAWLVLKSSELGQYAKELAKSEYSFRTILVQQNSLSPLHSSLSGSFATFTIHMLYSFKIIHIFIKTHIHSIYMR